MIELVANGKGFDPVCRLGDVTGAAPAAEEVLLIGERWRSSRLYAQDVQMTKPGVWKRMRLFSLALVGGRRIGLV